MKEALMRVSAADEYRLHQAIYARFSGSEGRRFIYAPLRELEAVLVRGDIDEGQAVKIPPLGAECDFALRAAISVHRRDGRREMIHRGDTVRRAEWLRRRGSENGFEVLHANVEHYAARISRGEGFTLDATRFLGRLRVTDTKSFSNALRNGIGKAKAFGFGTIVLIP